MKRSEYEYLVELFMKEGLRKPSKAVTAALEYLNEIADTEQIEEEETCLESPSKP